MAKTSKQKRPWDEDEDSALNEICQQFEKKKIDWKQVAQEMNNRQYNRDFKQCKDRYKNHLDHTVNQSQFTAEEEEKIFQAVKTQGSKWTTLATSFPNRTGLQIKNCFYAKVNKVYRRLIKAVFTPRQSTNQQLLPIVQSTLLCNDQNQMQNFEIMVDKTIQLQYQKMIFDNLDVPLNQEFKPDEIQNMEEIFIYVKILNEQYKQIKKEKQLKRFEIKNFQVQQKKIQKKNAKQIKHRIKMKEQIFSFDIPLLNSNCTNQPQCDVLSVINDIENNTQLFFPLQPMLISRQHNE